MIKYKITQDGKSDKHIYLIITHQDDIGWNFNYGDDTFVASDGLELKSRSCPAWGYISNSILYTWGSSESENLSRIVIPIFRINSAITAIDEYNDTHRGGYHD